MTDFFRRLVDRGLGAVPAGIPFAAPAQSGVGIDAKLNRNTQRPSIPETLDETESRETVQTMPGPAVDSRGSPRPRPSPVLTTPLVDFSPHTPGSRQPAKSGPDREPEPASTEKGSPIVPANQTYTRRSSESALDLVAGADAPAHAVAFRKAAASPSAIHPESSRAHSRPKVSRDSAANSATPVTHGEPLSPDAGKTPEPSRHGSPIVRDSSAHDRSVHDRPVNLILKEQQALSPRPASNRRDSGDAAPLRPARTTASPVRVPEAPRSRTTINDSSLQPLSPRAQRPDDLAPIVSSRSVRAPERSVSVRIGTIEVRAEAPAPVATPTPPTAPPAYAFEGYAALRTYARRSAQ